ncbi:MAG: LD-carboxypeptidase [Candidatus Omnitrophica bacterium]|nr:LD-carboxypeptidase [Candidatus Omnitrophota bacterium]
MIIKPKKLVSGDKIGIVTPSGPIWRHKEYLEKGMSILEEMGFQVKLGRNALKVKGYMAGSDDERLADIHAMFSDPEIKAILCSRGGEVAMRLLPLLDYNLIKKNPKIFLGMSDITILLNAIYMKTGLVTFHGPSLAWGINCSHWGFKGMEPYSKRYFLKALTESAPIGTIEPLLKWRVIRSGKAKGKLLGGNLDCVEKLLGTGYEPDWNGAILFLEELDEAVEEMERDLLPMRLRGILGKISGMVIGHLQDCIDGPEEEEQFIEMVLDITAKYGFPILKIEEFGHHPYNITIPIGVSAQINDNNFTILENGVI